MPEFVSHGIDLITSMAYSRSTILLLLVVALSVRAQECDDLVPPDSKYTCEEQKEFGQCNAKWMQGYCRITCGVCKPPTPLEVAAGQLDSNADLAVQPQALPSLALPGATQASTRPDDAPPPTVPPVDVPAQQEPAALVAPPLPPASTIEPATALLPTEEPSTEEGGCDPTAEEKTAYDILVATEDLSTLRDVVDVLGLTQVMKRKDVKFTMLAPTNKAFQLLATSMNVQLNELLSSTNLLRDILYTHLIPNEVSDAQTLGNMQLFKPQAGQPVFISEQPEVGLVLVSLGSSAVVVGPDFEVACTYAIHTIDTVLLPNPSPRTGVNPAYQALLARPANTTGPAGR